MEINFQSIQTHTHQQLLMEQRYLNIITRTNKITLQKQSLNEKKKPQKYFVPKQTEN